jgi:hypothetical protein
VQSRACSGFAEPQPSLAIVISITIAKLLLFSEFSKQFLNFFHTFSCFFAPFLRRSSLRQIPADFCAILAEYFSKSAEYFPKLAEYSEVHKKKV